MINIYAIENTPRRRPVCKVINTAQYLDIDISKVNCLRDLDINGSQGKMSQLCSVSTVLAQLIDIYYFYLSSFGILYEIIIQIPNSKQQ